MRVHFLKSKPAVRVQEGATFSRSEGGGRGSRLGLPNGLKELFERVRIELRKLSNMWTNCNLSSKPAYLYYVATSPQHGEN